MVRPRRRHHRGRGCDPDAGRGPDVPLQQPGCASRLAPHRRRLRNIARHRKRLDALAGSGRGPDRHRFSCQDAAGLRHRAGRHRGLPGRRRPRLLQGIKQLVFAGVAMVIASGWWVAIVQLWPSADRPYIGGSQDNNLLNLIFGYNGFGRLTGNETGSVGAIGAAGSRWGLTGWNRLFLNEFGGQISWLIPAAIVLFAAGLWFTLRARRTNLARASYLMWGGSLLVTGAVFSFAQGIIHPYYSIALAPAIGALVGAGSVELWNRRARLVSRWFLAATVVVTVVWAYVLLDRSPDWNPGLKVVILVAGLTAGALIVAGPLMSRPLATSVAALALVAALAGP